MKDAVVSIIVDLLEELRGQDGMAMPDNLDVHTPLFGREGILDSLGLVNLAVAVEQSIEEKFGVSVSLADEKALSQTRSPYRTVGSLAEYASSLLEEVA